MKHPVQKLVEDKHGVVRFTENPIVRYLLDAGPFDLNHIAVFFSDDKYREDHEQLAQLIGYSVCGFSDLPYASDEVADAAWEEMEEMCPDED